MNYKKALCSAVILTFALLISCHNADHSVQASRIVQAGLSFYWHGGSVSKAERQVFQGLTVQGRMDKVQNAFDRASALEPESYSYAMGAAFVRIAEKKIPEAQQRYSEIATKFPRSFSAPMLSALYLKAQGKDASAELAAAEKGSPLVYKKLSAQVAVIDLLFKSSLNYDVASLPSGPLYAVVFGYALGKGGAVQPRMKARIEKALALYKARPKTVFILTGGVAQGGMTEAYVMQQQLEKAGVPGSQLILEDRALDTVGNAVNCAHILSKMRLSSDSVVVITSASHMRRALTTLRATFSQQESLSSVRFFELAEQDYANPAQADKVLAIEKAVVYRDFMRSAGFWAFPGIQR